MSKFCWICNSCLVQIENFLIDCDNLIDYDNIILFDYDYSVVLGYMGFKFFPGRKLDFKFRVLDF